MKRYPVAVFGLVAFLCCLAPVSAQKSGVSPNVLVLPQGPGSLGGVGENVQPNLNMGFMSYQIKILVPKGRGDATPNPSITYSSSAGSGIVGIGWSFSAGSNVERGTVRGLPTYQNSDQFYAGGELVRVPGTSLYRARHEGGFVRYRWVQKNTDDQRGYWLAEYPDGSKGYFGANSKGELQLDAQIYGAKGTFRWELVTMVDRNGNRIEYTYFKDGPLSYPDEIKWVFDDKDQPLYKLKFLYEDRPDVISDGKPGFDLQTKKRLSEIQITSNEKRFRSYKMTFEEASGLSRLSKVVRYGRDVNSAYPVQFSMKYTDATFSKENSRMVKMPTSLGVDFRSGNIDFLDINGDGLPDVVDTAKPKHVFHINQLTLKADLGQEKHDFPSALMIENPKETSAKLSNPSVQMLDVNGDGFTDMVDAVNKKIYINKGNSKWEDGSMSLQNFPVTGKDPNMRFMDYNGDKKIDVISSDGSSTTFWVADGKGNWTVTPGKVNIGLGFSKDKLRLIDINGDGLQDVVHITKNSLRYRKYLGYGEWSDWIDVKINGLDKYELSTKAQFNDVNGDGMADMVAFLGNQIVYFVNKNGREFRDGIALKAFEGIDLPDSDKSSIRIADINGNGSRDIVWIDSSGNVVYLELFGKRPNLMKEISNGIGQRINVEYGSSVYFYLRDKDCKVGTDKACSGPWQNKMPMAFTVVTKITTWASRSDKPAAQSAPIEKERPQIQSIYYHNGFYDGMEKKFRGFRHVETLYDGDPAMGARKDEIKFDVGDKDLYMHGRQLLSQISDGAGKLYSQVTYAWGDCQVDIGTADASKLAPPVRFVCLQSQETKLIEGKPNEAKTLRVTYEYDGFGNQIKVTNEGDVDKEGDEQVTKTTYIAPKDAGDANALWMLRFRQKVESCDSKSADRCADTRYYYDGEKFKGLAAGEIRKGNITRIQERIFLGKEEFAETGTGYDKYGNTTASRDAEGNRRTYTWDEVYNLFAVKEVHELKDRKLEFSTAWDYAQSKVVRSTDANGQQKRYTYDVFGRLTEMYLSGDATDAPSVRFTYELKAPMSRIITDMRARDGKKNEQRSIQCFDGLGRRLSTMARIKGDKIIVSGHSAYTREGMLAQKWFQYYQKDDKCRFDAPSSTDSTKFFYDGMRRLTSIAYPDGTKSRREYLPLQVRLFDEEDNRKDSPHFDTPTIQLMDGLGRVVEVRTQAKKGDDIVQKFTHTNLFADGASKILKLTFPDGSEKVQEFDLRGNIVKVIDPDRSAQSYAYNKNNQRISMTDARGITVEYTYDALNRMVRWQQKDKPDTAVTYTYDVAPDGVDGLTFLKGKLSAIAYPGGRYLYSYDKRGRLIDKIHEVMGVRFSIKRTYNNAGLPLVIAFPNGQKLDFSYDDSGRLNGIKGKFGDLVYDDRARLTSWKAGNGVVTTWKYDKRNRIQSHGVGDGKVYTFTLQRDQTGNIMRWEQKHGDDSFVNEYVYDALYRLTSATVGSDKETLSYQQDKLHNIMGKSSSLAGKSAAHVGAYSYDSARIHAVAKAGDTKLAYDKAGQMTTCGPLTFQWDMLGRKVETSHEKDGVLARHWFDHSRRRVIKEEGGTHVFYIDDLYELRDGAFVSYVKLVSDRLVATWSAKGIETFFDDVGGGKADGQINAGDAIAYLAARRGDGKAKLKQRPVDIDMTRDMLNGSIQRMLLGADAKDVYYHVDHLGSVRAVTDDKGAVVQRKHYYPYGTVRATVGTIGFFVHGYQGTEFDKASRSNAFLLRSLDPKLGKWMSPDPVFAEIKGTQDEDNSYGSVLNNPIRRRDVQGGSSTLNDNEVGYVIAASTFVGFGMVFGAMYKLDKIQSANTKGALGLIKYGRMMEQRDRMAGHQAIVDQATAAKRAERALKAERTKKLSSVRRDSVRRIGMLGKIDAIIAAESGIESAKQRQKGRFGGLNPLGEGASLSSSEVRRSSRAEGVPRSRRRSSIQIEGGVTPGGPKPKGGKRRKVRKSKRKRAVL